MIETNFIMYQSLYIILAVYVSDVLDDVGNHNLGLNWLKFCHQDWVSTAQAINKKAQSYLLSHISTIVVDLRPSKT